MRFRNAELDAAYLSWRSDALPDEERGELTRHLATTLMGLPVGSRVGGLTLMQAGWSKETSERPEVKQLENDLEAWKAALGPHEYVVLGGDAFNGFNTSAWCTCEAQPIESWTYYERWTTKGRVAHGYIHSQFNCRRLVQAG